MAKPFQSLLTFISSPGDVKKERDIAENVINEINRSVKNHLNLDLEIMRWEHMSPSTPNLPEKRIQDIIHDKILKCNIFILILHKRYGSSEPGYKKSNTEREVNTAISLLKKEKKIMFLSYFRKLPENKDRGPQEKRVIELRNSLTAKGIWFKEYSTPEEFRSLLTHHLYRTVLKCRLATNKHNALMHFWRLGFPEKNTHPLLAIIYPPMDRYFMEPSGNQEFWFQRLSPNIVFEDYKALQKIEKGLRLIGFRDFRIYNTADIPPDLEFMNRFWICVPRSPKALQKLEEYKNVAKFKFVKKKEKAQSYIEWRSSLKSEIKRVYSPLAKYLKEQRLTMDWQREWNANLGQIVAKDFAVLARFNSKETSVNMREGTLKDFFLAGIRGLGTWGAAWSIDRMYNEFFNYPADVDIQMLLEVTYKDCRIIKVKDVSNKDQSYFHNQNKIKYIRDVIREYNQ